MAYNNGEAADLGKKVSGFGSTVHLAVNTSEYSHSTYVLQVSLLRRRFGLTAAAARLIAEHAFGRRAA